MSGFKVLRFTEEELESLNKVLDYLREDEGEDYESFTVEEEKENHVYAHILKVDAALDRK